MSAHIETPEEMAERLVGKTVSVTSSALKRVLVDAIRADRTGIAAALEAESKAADERAGDEFTRDPALRAYYQGKRDVLSTFAAKLREPVTAGSRAPEVAHSHFGEVFKTDCPGCIAETKASPDESEAV